MCVEFRTADSSVKTGGLYNFTRYFLSPNAMRAATSATRAAGMAADRRSRRTPPRTTPISYPPIRNAALGRPSILQGCCRAVWEGTTRALFADIFPDDVEAALRAAEERAAQQLAAERVVEAMDIMLH